MSVIGKRSSTLKKENVAESKLAVTGIKNLSFWHEAASTGETSIPYGSLNFPSAVVGESNPTPTEILAANLGLFKSNVKVFSSLNGELMVGLTCLVKNSEITFINGYETVEGEIFKVTYKNQAITGKNIVDARPLTATGTLTAGNTDFNVGEAFKTNAYPNDQMGEVMVFLDGEIQYRNVANATAAPTADGNYQEVHSSNGFGTIIRFNDTFGVDKPVIVISRNLIAERPDISMMQLIETLGGQIDTLIEYVAQDLGVDPLIFQVGPNQIDLKTFGDLVYQNKVGVADNAADIANILTAQVPIVTDWVDYTPTGSWTNTTYKGAWRRVGDSAEVMIDLICTGVPAGGNLALGMPSGMLIDRLKFPNNESHQVGSGQFTDAGTLVYLTTVNANTDTTVRLFIDQNASVVSNTTPFAWTTNDVLKIIFTVPIQGWISTQSLAEHLGL